MARRLLMVVNDAAFFLSHRMPIARAARDAGFDVHVATPADAAADRIAAAGFCFHPVPLVRGGRSAWREVRAVRALFGLYRRLRPDLAHHVTIKPVIYGGVAARAARVRAVVSAVSGLGYVFLARGPAAALRRAAVRSAYRVALRHRNGRVIFQNPDDRAEFIRDGIVAADAAVLIRGSGVDLAEFAPAPEVDAEPLVVLPSRLLWDKGVAEFVAAARALRARGVRARFALVGDTDPQNPAAVPAATLAAWRAQGEVEWWGWRTDMPEVIRQAHVVCLPSYREGLPKVLIEAAAAGRASVATDVPGCREVVRHEETGLLVPVRDAGALAAALARLVEDAPLRRRLGERARTRAAAEFSVGGVVRAHLGVYEELLA